MRGYRKAYEAVEGGELHVIVEEVTAAERQAKTLLNGIENNELRERLDSVFGAMARAYEIQGFNMGLAAALNVVGGVA